MEPTLYEFVMQCLDGKNETYQKIADGSGVPKRTVEKVARRETLDPGVSTVQQLADYFRKQHETTA